MDNAPLHDRLNLAMAYERSHAIDPRDRQLFHVCPHSGWMNDPNGFSLYRGEYHLFYQYNPYAPVWNLIHWGHYKTRDFITWEHLPVAMAPDEEYDRDGCFSGSALEVDGRHVLVYSGIREGRQAQCLAMGDGVAYTKDTENPVLLPDALPEGSDRRNFRDPKIWHERDGYYMLTGCADQTGLSRVFLFRSHDLRAWSFVSVFLEGDDTVRGGWECPDYFPLDGEKVLLVSSQQAAENGVEQPSGHITLAFIGDTQGHSFKPRAKQTLDYGSDFYAPQTLEAMDGRRIMIGWMHAWEHDPVPEGFPYKGMMTLPRELRIEGDRLTQRPVRELEGYRGEGNVVDFALQAGEARSYPGISGRALDLTLDVQQSDRRRLEIELACDERYKTVLRYDPNECMLTLDRSMSGCGAGVAVTRRMPVADRQGRLQLRVIMDRYSVEIFANHGKSVLTAAIFSPQTADVIRFRAEGTVRGELKAYPLVFPQK